MLGKKFSLEQEYIIRERQECLTPCYNVQTHFEEYRDQTDHKYKHQHIASCYIPTDVQLKFTSKSSYCDGYCFIITIT